MPAGTCPHCGGPNPIYALRCQWCGSGLDPASWAASNPPLATASSGISFSDDPGAYPEHEPDEPDRRKWGIVMVLVFIAVLLVGAVSASMNSAPTLPSNPPVSPPPTSVLVSEVVVTAPSTACGLNGFTPGGLAGFGGGTYVWNWSLPISGPTPCNVSSLSTNVSGFSFATNLPLEVPAGGSGVPLDVTVLLPSQYFGALYLTFH